MKSLLQGIILTTLTSSVAFANDFQTPNRPTSNQTFEAQTPEKVQKRPAAQNQAFDYTSRTLFDLDPESDSEFESDVE